MCCLLACPIQRNLAANHWQMWLNKKWYSNCLCHYCFICTSIISSKDQVTEVCSNAGYHSTFGALLWQFSPSFIQLSSTWKFSSSEVHLIFWVIDASDLRAKVVVLDPSPTQNACLLLQVIKLMCCVWPFQDSQSGHQLVLETKIMGNNRPLWNNDIIMGKMMK